MPPTLPPKQRTLFPPEMACLCLFPSGPGVRPLISPRFVLPYRSLCDPNEAADNSSKQQSRAAVAVVSATATGRRRATGRPSTTATRPSTLDHRERPGTARKKIAPRGGNRARAPTTSTASDPRPSRNVSGCAVRDRDIDRDYPRVRRPSDHRERLWVRGARSRAAHRRIFSKKTEAIVTRSCSQRLSGTRKRRGVSSRPHHVCYWGQLGSECLG